MNEHEATGRSVEEAVDKGLAELGIKKENAIIDIKAEPSPGILGLLGSKEAKVSVSAAKTPLQYMENYLKGIMASMKVEGKIETKEDEEKIEINISGQDVGILIGRRGKTLSDLQYLLNVALRRQYANLQKIIVLDIENYRVRREKTLTQLAKSVARKASQEGYKQALEPMSPQERRVIHIALQDYPGVTTYSDGEEPYRKVVIEPL